MLLDIEQVGNSLIVSYFDKTGNTKIKRYHTGENLNWKTCSRNDPYKSNEFVNWDGKPVKQIPSKRLNKWSQREFIHNLPEDERNEIEGLYFPKIQAIDIETEVIDGFPNPERAAERITVISIAMENNTVLSLGWKKLSSNDQKYIFDETRLYLKDFGEWNFKYISFDNEVEMLKAFMYKLFPKFNLITGWNIDGFDWPYIYNRCRNLGIDIVYASPTKSLKWDGKPYHVGIIDYLGIYKRYDTVVKIKVSNKLNWVAGHVLGVKKLTYNGTLQELYENDYNRYVLYNAIDSALIILLHKNLQTLNNVLSLANFGNITIDKASSPIALTESILWKGYYDNKMVIGNDKVNVERAMYEGAYVKEPVPGMYLAVAAFDFASLYPSIMRQFNMSPESFVKQVNINSDEAKAIKQDKKFAVAVNGSVYNVTKDSVLKKLLDDLYKQRRESKGKALLVDKKLNDLLHGK